MLRLEHLFKRLGELMSRESALDHHFALATLFEVMDVAARADMKSDVLKDLDKHKQQLNSYRGNPAISEAALDQVVGQLDDCFNALKRDCIGVADIELQVGELGVIRQMIPEPLSVHTDHFMTIGQQQGYQD